MIYFVNEKSELNINRKKLNQNQTTNRIKMNSSPHHNGALLCALSVGAAIVIARPNDAPEQPATPKQHSIQGQTNTVDTDSPSIWQKTKTEVKELALKSFDFGKRITFKTANVSAHIVERIGESVTTVIQWQRAIDRIISKCRK